MEPLRWLRRRVQIQSLVEDFRRALDDDNLLGLFACRRGATCPVCQQIRSKETA